MHQVQHFHYEDETSPIFQLETFGFRKGAWRRRGREFVFVYVWFVCG